MSVSQGHARLGPLSPPFISADDAARYVHERIDNRRDKEYGSVILQRLADQLYVATEPVAGRSATFDYTLLLDRESANGEFLQPPGYILVASLHSHPDTLVSTQQLNPKWSVQQVKTFMSFYSEPDILFNHRERLTLPYAYLSGPDGALLRYKSSASEAAQQYVRWLAEAGAWTSPHAHDGTLEGAYKKLASVGTLRFVESSPSWGGSVGDVPTDWQPYKPFTAPALPLACGPVFTTREQALTHAWAKIQRRPTLRQQVLILQDARAAGYIPSEPLLITPGNERLRLLPDGFHVHGIYIHSRPLPGQYPDLEAWLYKNFISPQELAQHIARFRGYANDSPSTLGASLFIRMRDEAILRYRFSGSPEESRLLAQESDLQAQLHNGGLLTRAFVLQVANAAELSVEKTSRLWDRPGVVDALWRPYANLALPPLSRAFLTADDAARHAHASIGGRRDQRFAGLVLQRTDGRYVITEPAPVSQSPFAFEGGYPKDRQGVPIIVSQGHRLIARYASCVALSMQADAGTWAHQEQELNGQMFTPGDVGAIHQSGLPAYLSGTPESLIVYQSGSTASDPKGTPSERVRTLAETGTLRVLTVTALWGPAEKLENDWAPFVRVFEFQRPDELSYGALFESADAAALDLHRRQPLRAHLRYAYLYFAFIFKHQTTETYVASELIPATQKTPLLSLPGVSSNAVPEGFACCGVFYARQWAGSGSLNWLERFFIVPDDLSIAITQSRDDTPVSTNGAMIYIAPPEGALLRYRSPSTQALFEAQSTGETYEDILAKLSYGTLTPLKFVRQVAEGGDLRVLRESPCWDRIGKVSGQWEPYAHLQRRRLGPAFLTMDDAARYVRGRVPVDRAAHYGGVILRRDDGWFTATEPVLVPDEVFDTPWVFPDELVSRGLYPVRMSVVASYHSRLALPAPFLLTPTQATVYANMVSTRVLAQAIGATDERLTYYVLGPDGSLISLLATPRVKYPPVTSQDLVTRPRNRHDWRFGNLQQRLSGGTLTPAEYVNRVATSFTLRVVEGSAMWGARGPVSNWRPFAPTTATQAEYDPACSPLCTRPDDAARYVHQQVTLRSELSFGYLLKSLQNGHCVATLPVAAAGLGFGHRRVFSDAGYPHRYDMAGLYMCIPLGGEFYPAGRMQAGDEIFNGLFSPRDLKAALAVVHATQARASLPLYLSCADGALLKFEVRDARFAQYSDLLNLRNRLLSPRDFIRRMAAAGDLDILQSSTNWPGLGRVGSQWQPGRSMATLAAPQWALGPIHAHCDDAAHYAHHLIGAFSGKQYLGALLENPTASTCLPVLPVEDQGFPSAIAEPLQQGAWPKGYRLIAAHTVFHAGLDQPSSAAELSFRQYFVSWRELGYYVHNLKAKGLLISGFYLSTRDGALLSYVPQFSNEEYNLLDSALKWSPSTGYTHLAPVPSRVITELARIGELRVIHAGVFWRLRDRLGASLQQWLSPSFPLPAKDEL